MRWDAGRVFCLGLESKDGPPPHERPAYRRKSELIRTDPNSLDITRHRRPFRGRAVLAYWRVKIPRKHETENPQQQLCRPPHRRATRRTLHHSRRRPQLQGRRPEGP